MKHINSSPSYLFGILLFSFLGCSTSNETASTEFVRTEITASGIENADVNSTTFWNNTKLAWSDEFNENQLDSEKWYFETFRGGQDNTELQDFTDNNIEFSNGILKIQAKKTGPGQNVSDYTSARMVSKFAFTYGKLEIRAKHPTENGNGLWSKIWLLGNNVDIVGYPDCGEMMFTTYFSHEPGYISAIVNTGSIAKAQKIQLDTAEEEFHPYGLLWTDEYLKFYIDDIENVYYTYHKPEVPTETNWPFSQSFYFGMDMSVGGEYGGVEGVDDSIFPADLEIDYVRVYHPV